MTTSTHVAGRSVCRFTFSTAVDMALVEGYMLQAILAAECIHGEVAVRLSTGYSIDCDSRQVAIEVGPEPAHDAARVFVGLCTAEFGAASFLLERHAAPIPQLDSAHP